MAQYLTPTMLIPVLVITFLLVFVCYWWTCLRQPPLLPGQLRPKVSFTLPCYPMGKQDALPLVLITLAYALTAFFQLGSFSAPQSRVDFQGGRTVEYDFGRTVYAAKLMYFPSLGGGAYNVEISADGDHWSTLWTREGDDGKTQWYWADAAEYDPSYAMPHKYNDLFKWKEIKLDNPQNLRYLRITGKSNRAGPFQLAELGLIDQNGALIAPPQTVVATQPGQAVTGEDMALFDEQDTVPEKMTWFNSAYFDEIYHPRTALEHIEGVSPYEVSHPPLGKLILSLGIRLFGMTPFGWRFMGTLFGVLMLPILYVFLKNLFGKTVVAACGTALFAFDFMHLTQTRIATIDTYGVFFILLMYFFLYRYLTLPAGTSFRKGALPLFLSGLSWGLGAASKWTVIYGGVGLAILYFVGLGFKARDWPRDETGAPVDFAPWCAKTIAFSVLCFVVIPVVIYTLSYWPYAVAKGDTSLGGLVKVMLENQKFMFTYHQGVHDPHPYESRWYQWIVDGRPILYYLDNADTKTTGLKAAFGCFNNPVVAWTGLLVMVSLLARSVMGLLLRPGRLDVGCAPRPMGGRALFIVVGYFSQLAPWFLIGRTTFEYHYFPSTLFLVLAICFAFHELIEYRPKAWKGMVYSVTGLAVALYPFFYPVLIGLTVPQWYTTHFLRWIGSWPF